MAGRPLDRFSKADIKDLMHGKVGVKPVNIGRYIHISIDRYTDAHIHDISTITSSAVEAHRKASQRRKHCGVRLPSGSTESLQGLLVVMYWLKKSGSEPVATRADFGVW